MSVPPAFALLHGCWQGSWVWRDTAAALRKAGAEVVLLDVPGCGTKRDRDTIALTPNDVVGELLGDIAAAGLKAPVLVGHSQGGTLLPILWRRAGGCLARLIHLACCAPVPGESIIDMMGRGRHGDTPGQIGWPLDPATTDRATMRRATMGNDMHAEQFAAFIAEDGRDSWPMPCTLWVDWQYDDLRDVPASYIVCERDGILPVAWQERFAARLQVDRVARIDAGHQAMITQPRALAALLLAETQT